MPVTGRKPKPGPKRNRARLSHDWTEVEDRPFKGGPKLPAHRPDGQEWPAATREWWKAVSSMPHCTLWGPGDWQFALDSAFVAAALHDGNLRQAAELRQREKVLGTTADARRDLRIRLVDELEEEVAAVDKLEDFRRRFATPPSPPPRAG